MNLADYWDEHCIRAYQGVSVADFPKFSMIYGPYGHNDASFFTLIENNTAHITR